MLQKLNAFTKKVADLPDKPNLNPAELKAQFDAAPEELRQSFNNLVDALNTQEGLTTFTPQNGWVSYSGSDGAYYKDSLGVVHLYGRFMNGTTTNGTTLASLPNGYRPIRGVLINARGFDLAIGTDGTMSIYSVTSPVDIGIDGISFRAQ